ncbi:MAG: type II toxin-antitoxin system mRNA interferase toxin, RelE/StbE family [Candidatus Gracilibacteria bacterium]|jgi:addiction module RelE/StbE family toxin
MIEINYQDSFVKDFKKLPLEIRQKASELEELFRKNPFHPLLHAKKLQGSLSSFFSFRITREYRVIYRFCSKDEVAFLAVKHRKDIYK